MDNIRPQEFPLTDTLQEILQQGASQALELRDTRHIQHTMQTIFLEVERRYTSVKADINLKEKILCALHCDIQDTQHNICSLGTQIQEILLENLKLRSSTEEQLEKQNLWAMTFSSYHKKMELYIQAVRKATGRGVCEQLTLKEQEVCELKHTLKDLEMDLQNPTGTVVLQVQKEVERLKSEVCACRRELMEKQADVKRERETHSQLRRDIEIQKRRCEAVLKRLHCQVKKAQCCHRQLRSDITHLQRKLEELRTCVDRSSSS